MTNPVNPGPTPADQGNAVLHFRQNTDANLLEIPNEGPIRIAPDITLEESKQVIQQLAGLYQPFMPKPPGLTTGEAAPDLWQALTDLVASGICFGAATSKEEEE